MSGEEGGRGCVFFVEGLLIFLLNLEWSNISVLLPIVSTQRLLYEFDCRRGHNNVATSVVTIHGKPRGLTPVDRA